MKFGGSAVDGPEEIRQVAHRLVVARDRGLRVVATVSAMGRTTDSLLELARRVSSSPAARELDMLLSTGERSACALVAMAIHDLGREAVSFTGSQAGILTDAAHTKAAIREITPVRVLQALDAGRIVLVAGLQGFSRETMDVTTLGRGGTDTTAVALAASLGAACEIYSDVDGVFSADPHLVPDARRLDAVSYDDMQEMAASGARVLALRAVELAQANGIPVHARSAFGDGPGTLVRDVAGGEKRTVTAVTHSPREVLVTVRGLDGELARLAELFAGIDQEQVDVDLVYVQDGGSPALSFAVTDEDAGALRRALEDTAGDGASLDLDELAGLAKVSLVGAGLGACPGVAALVCRTLAREGIDTGLLWATDARISCLVASAAVERAVRALHAAFALDAEATDSRSE
jgi:aspartate kinase